MAKILPLVSVDTSVWIAYLRGGSSLEIIFNTLLDQDKILLPIPVKIELISGVRKGEVKKLNNLLERLPILYPTLNTWSLLEESALLGSKKGYRFGIGDLLIGTLAQQNRSMIWSLDSDFTKMEELSIIENFKVGSL